MTNQKFVYGVSKEVLTVSQMDTLLISFTPIYSIFQWLIVKILYFCLQNIAKTHTKLLLIS